MTPVWTLLSSNNYFVVGLVLTVIGSVLLSLRTRYSFWMRLAPASLALLAFGYWSFYWHLRSVGAPELSAIILATLPLVLGFLFITRSVVSSAISKVGRLKFGDLQLEFDRIGQRLEHQIIPTISVDEAVFSRKRSVANLHQEVRHTIEKLSLQPLTKRDLYVQVDFGRRSAQGYFDASALYVYLLVLREAAENVRGRLVGVLIYESHVHAERFFGLVRTADYITECERRFPTTRSLLDLEIVRRITNNLNAEETNKQYQQLFSSLDLNSDTSLRNFIPHLRPHLRKTLAVEEQELQQLPKRISELIEKEIEFIIVRRRELIVAVVPIQTITASLAKILVDTLGSTSQKH